ncbi:hypothetical protein PRK78_005424 [Emydomyces testavorans]|uniref:Uncharacterized protein n=1 Tax=Emydomyces testavorans TaxID=2070801 RepID=A0AAF0DJR2_9EURO|nr:hypothetical protein PRK78_005424 [Emydomyces testavorans]
MVDTNKPMGETLGGVLAPVVSHGRGGQGNIHADDTLYVDGAITRQGPEGDQGDGAYSAGRGGAGNIGSPHVKPNSKTPHDKDVIPPLAIRPSMEGDYHVGRGGHGNVSHETDRKTSEFEEGGRGRGPEEVKQEGGSGRVGNGHDDDDEYVGLADKLKYKLFGWK